MAGPMVALAVYAGTNVFGTPPATTTNLFYPDAAFDYLSMTFQALAGTDYQIQFFGTHPTLAMTFRLVATNSPVVLENPGPQTVFPGGSALFTVVATGLEPLSYQWQWNGTNLPGATSAMLALNNITPDQAGAYSVAVSSSTEVTTTASAALVVCNNNLKQIRFARDLWRRSSRVPQPRTTVPAWSDLLPQVSALYCPLLGSGPAMASYYVNNVLTEPECFISASHILEEPQ
jgi:hypothetical protein